MVNYFNNESDFMNFMIEPDEKLVNFFRNLKGDLMILGIGGKIGWNLGGLAVNAAKLANSNIKILGVSRFKNKESREHLEKLGIKTIKCNLSNEDEVNNLPHADNIIYMVGKKFGTIGNENSTWGTNTVIPTYVAKKFAKSRIVVFSTGCVYDFVNIGSGGSLESDSLTPIGEYANSCIGRERVFSYYSDVNNTKVCIFRLNYAVELRYGIIREIVDKVKNNEDIDVSMGQVNVIWQPDAARYALLLLDEAKSPATVFNVTGPETISVRYIAEYCSKKMNLPVSIIKNENSTALLSNSSKLFSKYGYPLVPLNNIIDYTIDWVLKDGSKLDAPTHYETRNGEY